MTDFAKAENLSGDEYKMNCIKCGSIHGLEMAAHRNNNGGVTGYIFTCQDCKGRVLGSKIADVFGFDSGASSVEPLIKE